MSKMGIPLGAICNKMRIDSMSATDIAAVRQHLGGDEASTPPGRGRGALPGGQPRVAMKKLHWTSIAPDKVSGEQNRAQVQVQVQ
jgi:hypothetical protein